MKKFLTAFVLTFAFSIFLAGNAQAQQDTITFEVLTPKQDQTLYGQKIPILFNVENFQLADTESSKVTPGEGHILLWLDQDTTTTENSTKVVENTFIYSDVKFGEHTLQAELVTADNKSLTPPQKITVSFKTETLPQSESPAISNSFDKTTAIVILAIVALVIMAAWWYTKDEDDSEGKPPETKKSSSKKKVVRRKKTRK